jgi:hypothetical protein
MIKASDIAIGSHIDSNNDRSIDSNLDVVIDSNLVNSVYRRKGLLSVLPIKMTEMAGQDILYLKTIFKKL